MMAENYQNELEDSISDKKNLRDEAIGINCRRVPNFYIETILNRYPVHQLNDIASSTQKSENNQIASLQHNHNAITNVENLNSNFNLFRFHTPNHVEDIWKRFYLDRPQQNCFLPNPDDCHPGYFLKFSLQQNLLHLRQRIYQSTLCDKSSAANNQFSGRFVFPSTFASHSLSCRQNLDVGHFDTWPGYEFRPNLQTQIPFNAFLQTQIQSDNSQRTSSSYLDKAENILFQLNRLSETVPLQPTQERNNVNKKNLTDTKGKKPSSNGTNLINLTSYDQQLVTVSSRNASKQLSEKSSKIEKEHPAWVFCTRYSDRPCAGPRIRRTKKEEFVNGKPNTSSKRERTAFSEDQLAKLQAEFEDFQYLTEERRVRLSKELGLSVSQIKVWFQNKRAKVKKASGVQSRLKMGLIASGIYEHGTILSEDKD